MRQVALERVIAVPVDSAAARRYEYSLIKLLLVIAGIGILGSVAVLPEHGGLSRDPLIALLVVVEVVGILMAIGATRFRS